MTAPLRSTQFWEGVPPVVGGVNTWTTEYTVPSGHRIIVKHLHMFNPGASAKIGGVRVNAALVLRQLTMQAFPTAPFQDDWPLWVVLNPGETLQFLQQPSGAVQYVASGYLLYI